MGDLVARETNNSGDTPGIGLVLILVAATAGGLYLTQETLRSSRPTDGTSFPVSPASEETVDSRLWQDPLGVIQRDWDRLVTYTIEQDSPPSILTFPPTIKAMRHSPEQKLGDLLVVGALLNGGPYAEDAENRRRSRYALVSALALADYVPSQSDRIGYFLSPQYDLPLKARDRPEGYNLALVGFEWFKLRPSGISNPQSKYPWKSILVVWLNSRDFSSNPLHHFRLLLEEITQGKVEKNGSKINVAIIGPPDSNALEDMARISVPKDEAKSIIFRNKLQCFPNDSWKVLDQPGGCPDIVDQEFFPNPNELEFLTTLKSPIEYILYEIDNYLDYGLTYDAEIFLRNCLENQQLSECLEAGIIENIVDSDSDWRDTVISLTSDYEGTNYPQDTAQAIREVSKNEEWIESLLLDTHYYLDFGLSNPKNSEQLRDCLDEFRDEFIKESKESENIQKLSDCLKNNLNIEDSDPYWYTTVAEYWLEANSQFLAKSNSPNNGNASKSEPLPIHIFSPRSTVPLNQLLGKQPSEFPENPKKWDDEMKNELDVTTFRSVLARDDAVLLAVVKELMARGLDATCTGESPIAIISELDSTYGRAIKDIVESAIANELKCLGSKQPKVHFFGYLRGVDGELPWTERDGSILRNGTDTQQQDEGQSASLFPSAVELAVGPTQVDYIRRLADTIGRHSETHVTGSGFQAIGVFGADVYDKQLILQALRERLPNVRFFTTDLDARLSDPSKYRWNRNLIIGSAYGLSLPVTDVEVPPFRGSYETAFFRATQLALGIGSTSAADPVFPPHPRVFEIGRSGAIDITVCNPSSKLPCGDDDDHNQHAAQLGWLQHSGSGIDRAGRILVMLLPLLALAGVSFVKSGRLPHNRQSETWRAHRLVLRASIVWVILTAIMLVIWSFWNSPTWEPFLLFEGVSAVPTLVLHVTTIAYAIAIILIGAGRISQSKKDAVMEFKFYDKVKPHAFGTCKNQSCWQYIRQNLAKTSVKKWRQEVAENSDLNFNQNVDAIWNRYNKLGGWGARSFRAVKFSAGWTLVLWLLFVKIDPSPLLVREIGDWIELVRILTLFSTLTAVFLCTDALRLSQVYIEALAANNIIGWKRKPNIEEDRTCLRWRTMRVIVAHTEYISPLIVLPFILVFFLLLARGTIFDAWTWTPTLIAVYAGFSTHLLVRGLLFQRSASKCRETMLDDLNLYRQKLVNDPSKLKETELVMDRIRSFNKGAFVPWNRHPILQSIALPSSGVGLLALLNA